MASIYEKNNSKMSKIDEVTRTCYDLHDITIRYDNNIQYYNMGPNITYDSQIETELYNSNIYDIVGTSFLTYFSLNRGSFQAEFSPEMKAAGYASNKTYLISKFHSIFANESLYNSKQFLDQVFLINGTTPTAPDQIMVDWLFAQAFDLQVGQSYNLSYRVRLFHFPDVDFENIFPNISLEISGIYALAEPLGLMSTFFYPQYQYNPDTQRFLVNETSPGIELNNNLPFFGYFNFSNAHSPELHQSELLQQDHKIFKMARASIGTKDWYYRQTFYYGLGVFLDHAIYSQNNLLTYSKDMIREFKYFEFEFHRKISVHSQYIMNIYVAMDEIYALQQILLGLNVPVIGFTILIGAFAIINETKNRMEEFMLLRSKGMKTQTLGTQLLVEQTVLSVVASLFGIVLGIPIFFGLKSIFEEFLKYYNITHITFSFSLNPLETSLVTALFLSIVISIQSISFIRGLPAHKLLKKIGEASAGEDHSERTIFFNRKDTQQQKSYNEFKDNQPNQKKKEPKKPKTKKEKQKAKLDRIYQRSLNKHHKKIRTKRQRKWGILFVILGLIPLFLLFASVWAQNQNSPDFIQRMFLSDIPGITPTIYYIIPIVTFLMPVFLSIGVMRILGVDYSHLLAKFVAFTTKPFLGKVSELLGIETIRKKQYSRIMAIIGVFVGMLVISNTVLYSYLEIPILNNQAEAGADLKIQFFNQPNAFSDSQISSMEDILSINQEILHLQNSENESYVKDITFVVSESIRNVEIDNTILMEILCFANFTELYQILSEENKYLPDKNFGIFQHLSPKTPEGTPNCVITSNLANFHNVSEGGTLPLLHNAYNFTENTNEIITINAQVDSIIDIIPGLWLNSYLPVHEEEDSHIYNVNLAAIMDISILNEMTFDLGANFSITHLIDLKDEIPINYQNVQHLEEEIKRICGEWYANTHFSVYIDSFTEYDDLYGFDLSIQMINYAYIMEFVVIGIILAFGIAILMISFQQANKHFNGVLLARGFGKRGLFKFSMSLMLFMIIMGYLLGIISGFLSSFSTFSSVSHWENVLLYGSIAFPVKINWGLMIPTMILIPGITILIYCINYIVDSKKSVSKYFHKF